jgi:ArsR family transcriptional regulator, arsenate/arsenite/antimonite-responsive transcriptional repressor / arsenate reductase (thioredoxin)
MTSAAALVGGENRVGALDERARIHAALGEPSRLAVVDRLVLGDASPGELARDLALPGNLLAHHLKVLEQAGVVHRTRSEADRRRTYVGLVPAALTALVPRATLCAPRVVFVCSHNSARSRLAASLWSGKSTVPASSAGTHPAARVHPGAVATARRHRLHLGAGRPVHVSGVLRPGDLVVAVCDAAHEHLGARAAERLHWSVPDPVRIGTAEAFEHAVVDLADRVGRLAQAVEPTREETSDEPDLDPS